MDQPIEITLLGVAVLIGFIQLMWAALAARRSGQDLKWAGGPRDEERPIGVVAARLKRAFANFMETFPLFAAAILVCIVTAKLGTLTMVGSLLYVLGRAAYVPLYASGVHLVRSMAWAVAIVGLLMVTAAIFV
jgi:uncharacterized MAPEG superfamily protein